MILKKPKLPQGESLVLQDTSFLPGQSGMVKLNAGKLPSGSKLDIVAHVFRSNNPGPVFLLLGGIHGDEINGIEIITSLLESKVFENLTSGSIIAIPLLNVFGFNNFSRDMPDGKDVNRSFPGSTSGSLASRVARTLTKFVLPIVDYAIDLHTGSSERYNHAQARYTRSDVVSKKMAEIFAAPFIIRQALISNSFRKVAFELDTHVLVYEGGESVRVNQNDIQLGIEGILRVLHFLSMIPASIPASGLLPIEILKTRWVRAAHPGIFINYKKSGEKIFTGDTLGVIKDPYGLKSYPVTSRLNGYIIGHNNAAVVNQGDALYHIGITDEAIHTGF
ncbi:MAG: succinylglutamate desuccinylase/aspartoacylase family protein [Saprospiraceae bacterium]|nr:succinylglutamate desuccinylase/aspartoacylase family protein [Saprospiraceae bacterium]